MKNPTKLPDSGVLEVETVSYEEEQENAPFSTLENRRTVVLVMDEGILRELPWGTDDLEREMKKANDPYRRYTADGRFVLIDYDKEKARPFVKALLAKVGKLKEVKMLWWVIWLSVIFFVISAIAFAVQIAQLYGLSKQLSQMAAPRQTLLGTPIQTTSPQGVQNVQDVQDVPKEEVKSSAQQNVNRLFK